MDRDHAHFLEAKRRATFGKLQAGISEAVVVTCENIVTTARFMQLCCEGFKHVIAEFSYVRNIAIHFPITAQVITLSFKT